MRLWTLPASASTVDDLVLSETPSPEPGAGQVRLRVGAISINARDQMVLAGPFGRSEGVDLIPLSDVAGTVDAVGDGVAGVAVGDRVMTAHVPAWVDGRAIPFGPGPGSGVDQGVSAEQIVVDAAAIIGTPDQLDDMQASTLQVAGVTAWNAMFGAHPVVSGDTVVVLGSGGVAIFAAQFARAVGARVIVVLRSAGQEARWTELGVDHVVIADGGTAWAQKVVELGGATKIVNTVGTGILNECLAALAPGGEIAVPGLYDMSAPPLDVWTLIGAQASIRGVAVGSVEMHRHLARFVVEHDIRPVIDAVVPFDRLPDAYRAQGARGTFGKVVIDVTSPASA